MPTSSFAGSLSTPTFDVGIETGNPFLNRTVDGFLKIGAVAATKSAAGETYHILNGGSISGSNVKNALKKMCSEGAYWGTVGGVYEGMEYGVERLRNTYDWKNAMIGGALTGALISAVNNKDKDKIVMNAFTGAAIATASKFLNHLHNKPVR